MSILFINSSPNPHGNTARVAAALLESKEYETLNLAEYKIYGYGQQFPDDQFMEVIDKIRAAKTIVIGSPLYWHNLSGLLRCFLDRDLLIVHLAYHILKSSADCFLCFAYPKVFLLCLIHKKLL